MYSCNETLFKEILKIVSIENVEEISKMSKLYHQKKFKVDRN